MEKSHIDLFYNLPTNQIHYKMFKIKRGDIFQQDNNTKHKPKWTEKGCFFVFFKVVWVFRLWRGEHNKEERSMQ